MNKYARSLRLGALTLALAVVGGLVALALGVPWAFNTGAAAPTGNLTCNVKATCDAGEVAVFRMSSTSNAHAGTAAGSGYGYSVCCSEVCHLSTSCSGVHDTVLTLSAADNAHVAPDGSYGTGVCLSVPHGVADCTYGPSCAAGYECVATVSGSTNAHVADCDGIDDYATKVCCRIVDDCDNDGILDPDEPDDDDDAFDDDVESYLGTDSCDDCTNDPGVHDAWPLDINMSRDISVTGDVFYYRGRIGATPGSPNWLQRLDLNMSGDISVTGDVFKYRLKIGLTCT